MFSDSFKLSFSGAIASALLGSLMYSATAVAVVPQAAVDRSLFSSSQAIALTLPPEAQPAANQSIAQAQPRLPRRIANAVRRDISRQTQIPRRDLTVSDYSAETWTDGCLGLGGPAESCLMAMTPGWRVTVTDGSQTWVYRTNRNGTALRSETAVLANRLPDAVQNRVRQAAAEESVQPVSQIQVYADRATTWNGCLGLSPGLDGVCTAIAISGWQVLATDGDQAWVFHSNETGSDVRFNATASPSAGVLPGFLDPAPSLEAEVLLQATTTGGIAGRSQTIQLLQNGDVVQIDERRGEPTRLKTLSPAQVQTFDRLLQAEKVSDMNGLLYLPSQPAADFQTITLSTPYGTTAYADLIQGQLPEALQTILAAWEPIATVR